jgi:hypothetical protein
MRSREATNKPHKNDTYGHFGCRSEPVCNYRACVFSHFRLAAAPGRSTTTKKTSLSRYLQIYLIVRRIKFPIKEPLKVFYVAGELR